jgi:retron-type reverse transcriptase
MVELLAAATENAVLSRLRMGGHTYPDIEMALDPKNFGLDKDWLTLEAEFKEYKTDVKSEGKNFKDFLRLVHAVSIDQKTIEAALSMTQKTPVGIKSIIDDIVASAFQTDLLHDLF